MEIINEQFLRDLETGIPLKLDLGGGLKKRSGFYSLDQHRLSTTDALADLNCALDLIPDNSAEYVYSRHAFEHIEDLLPLMGEVFRISKAGAKIEIVVPHFSNVFGYSDPTHVRFFGIYSMNYFMGSEGSQVGRKVPSYYSSAKFKNLSVAIEFYRFGWIDRIFAKWIEKFVNRNIRSQEFYERRLCHLFHAWQIRFEFSPDK